MRTLTVSLGARSYPIYLGGDLLGQAGELIQRAGLGEKVAVITQPRVAGLYLPILEPSLKRAGFRVVPVIIPEGEEHKSLASLSLIYDRLIEERFDRTSCLVALGGGVVGDLAGFAAATFLRGVAYVQAPTTLLAQVDSSVGGKTGVNHRAGKNLIGAFYQPRLVISDVGALRTLSPREFVAGLAEVIKYGVIADLKLFAILEQGIDRLLALDQELLVEVIATSCAIKARVVECDEHEEDYRSVLNFGHTVGHALEALTGYEKLLHGEAVAIGMVQAAAISARHGVCDETSQKRITELVRKAGLPTGIPSGIEPRELVNAMEVDKKSLGGRVKFVLCQGIGATRFDWFSAEEIVAQLTGE